MSKSTQLGSSIKSPCVRVLTGLACVSLLVSGCAERRARTRAYPWGIAAGMHPITPAGALTGGDGESAVDELADSLLAQITPPPSPLILARSVPTRPRVPAGNPTPTETARPDVPQIAPQLSAAETAAARQQTSQSLGVAGKNLDATQGRTLNGTQSDLASKVRSFITEAKEAAQIGDWARARNAAKKAEVLSQELANSL